MVSVALLTLSVPGVVHALLPTDASGGASEELEGAAADGALPEFVVGGLGWCAVGAAGDETIDDGVVEVADGAAEFGFGGADDGGRNRRSDRI